MRAAIVVLLLSLACGPSEEEAPAEAPAETAEPEPAVEEPMIDEPEEEEPLPALGERELDEMDQPDLEAACFGGSTAACDRLGH